MHLVMLKNEGNTGDIKVSTDGNRDEVQPDTAIAASENAPCFKKTVKKVTDVFSKYLFKISASLDFLGVFWHLHS